MLRLNARERMLNARGVSADELQVHQVATLHPTNHCVNSIPNTCLPAPCPRYVHVLKPCPFACMPLNPISCNHPPRYPSSCRIHVLFEVRQLGKCLGCRNLDSRGFDCSAIHHARFLKSSIIEAAPGTSRSNPLTLWPANVHTRRRKPRRAFRTTALFSSLGPTHAPSAKHICVGRGNRFTALQLTRTLCGYGRVRLVICPTMMSTISSVSRSTPLVSPL